MDRLWCAAKARRKCKAIISDEAPANVPDDWSSQTTDPAKAPTAMSSIPEVNMDLSGMELFSLVIARGQNGFGFTVFGASPVQVGRVDEVSPSFKAGLRRSDFIVRINGLNVSRSMAESVARIVRDTESTLRLEVHRYSTDGDTSSISPWSLYSDDDGDRFVRPEVTLRTNIVSSVQRPCVPTGKPQLPPRRPLTQLLNVQGLHARSKVSADQLSLRSFGCDQPPCELSRLSAPVEATGSPCLRVTPLPGSRPRKKAPMPLPPPSSENRLAGSGDGSRVAATEETERREGDKGNAEEEEEEEKEEEDERESCCSDTDGKWSPITDDKKISSFEQDQRPAILKLVECEEEFVLQMELGLQRYLRPLKTTLLTPEDHWTVFQNLEEVVALSQRCLREIDSGAAAWCSSQEEATKGQRRTDGATEDRRLSIRALSSVYLSKVESFCSAYESYCPGVMNSLHFLSSLKRSNPELHVYLKKTSLVDGFTISAFLQKPIEHIKELVLTLQRILCYMESTTSDYSCLKQVVQAMRNCCSAINVSHTTQRLSSSMSSLSSLESIPMKSFSSSSSSANSAAASVVSSIDTEVFEMQKRLVFPDNIRSFHLATASHHMIYSGRLTLCDRHASLALYVALLSDLVLLTRPDPAGGDALCVVEEPILLKDVVGCNFNCSHQCEFVISVETPLTSLQKSWTPRSLVFRAPSAELKCTWKNLLEQRISSCKAQREMTITSRRTENII